MYPSDLPHPDDLAAIRDGMARSDAEIERLKASGEWERLLPAIRAIYAGAGWHTGTAVRLIADHYQVSYRTAEIWLDEAIEQ